MQEFQPKIWGWGCVPSTPFQPPLSPHFCNGGRFCNQAAWETPHDPQLEAPSLQLLVDKLVKTTAIPLKP